MHSSTKETLYYKTINWYGLSRMVGSVELCDVAINFTVKIIMT